jgi:hypothetical protein
LKICSVLPLGFHRKFTNVKYMLAVRRGKQGECEEMTKYRMRVFCPGSPEPQLWQTHDIFAEDDATAKAMAQEKYETLSGELVRSNADLNLVNFSLCGYDGQLVYETPRRDRR